MLDAGTSQLNLVTWPSHLRQFKNNVLIHPPFSITVYEKQYVQLTSYLLIAAELAGHYVTVTVSNMLSNTIYTQWLK